FVRAVEQFMPYLVDRVMGEGSLYAPELAALALAQTGGDLYEAGLLFRAYRSTQPRLAHARPVGDATTPTLRPRFAPGPDIPGGQILGPTLDYSHRILRTDVLDERPTTKDEGRITSPADLDDVPESQDQPGQLASFVLRPSSLPPVAGWLRLNGLLADLPE